MKVTNIILEWSALAIAFEERFSSRGRQRNRYESLNITNQYPYTVYISMDRDKLFNDSELWFSNHQRILI